MSESKHTPGPWVVEDETDPMLTILAPSANGDVVAHIVDVDWLDDPAKVGPQCLANARLIAAAPDLLEALTELTDAAAKVWSDPFIRGAVDRARAAILKATGEQG